MFHGQVGDNGDYGSHVATHMSLGLLFLGGGRYTLNTSPVGAAVLLCALFPVFPNSPSDNRAHIQAARHLWVLAVEPRCLIARDVETGDAAFLPLKLRVFERDPARSPSAGSARSHMLVSPTLMPEIPLVNMIRVDSPRYWPITLNLGSNEAHRATFLRARTLFVKRRAGHLSYLEDPRGTRSVFTRSKAEVGSAVFDLGHTAAMLAPSTSQSSGTNDGEGGGGGYEYFLSAFSPDAEAKGAIDHLVKSGRCGSFEAFCASVVMECLTQDKRDVMAVYHSLYLARAGSQRVVVGQREPAAYTALLGLRNFLLVVTFYEHDRTLSRGRQTLVHRALLDTMLMDAWREAEQKQEGETDTFECLVSYLTTVVSGQPQAAWPPRSHYSEGITGASSASSSARLANVLRLTDAPSVGTLLTLYDLVRRQIIGGAAERKVDGKEEVKEAARLVLTKTLRGLDVRDREARLLAAAMADAWVTDR
jgi:hypothetical protein